MKINKNVSELWQLNKELTTTEGLKHKHFVKQLYEHIAEILSVKDYSETSIKNLFGSKIYKSLDYNFNTKAVEFENIQDITNYLYDNTNETDYKILTNNEKFKTLLYNVTEYFTEKIEEDVPEEDTTTDKIKKLLKGINEANRIESGSKKKLISLLEKKSKSVFC